MSNYIKLQHFLSYVNEQVNTTWHSTIIKHVEYEDNQEEDEEYEDMVVIDCVSKLCYFRIKMLFSNDNVLVYVSYIPGDSIKLHNSLQKLNLKWNINIPGYLIKKFNLKELDKYEDSLDHVLFMLHNVIT
ncbi:hypothetical protein N9C10_03025 [Flavobacteriaceae bacterium]|nr:hypothetical protein [Flavobacteriaceae bacterium]